MGFPHAKFTWLFFKVKAAVVWTEYLFLLNTTEYDQIDESKQQQQLNNLEISK